MLHQIIDDVMWLSEFENENVNGVDETRKLTKIWLIFLVYVSLKVTDHHLGGQVKCKRDLKFEVAHKFGYF